ncbi:MAG: hypothetical protein L3J26_09900 [Candidatus Polarisedimenticolaceae bacterium]|nr:hypothetical protein [Candidatus Polarisedimenticolaceae bacterium]
MPSFSARHLPLLLVAVLLAGCQTIETKARQVSLDKVLHAYETAIRWSYIHQAYSLMRPERLKEIEIPQGLENIKVTHYEVLEPAVSNPKSDTATQVAFVSYVEKNRQQEKRLTDHQLWEYDKKAKRWYLISDIPAFIVQPKMRVVPPGQ